MRPLHLVSSGMVVIALLAVGACSKTGGSSSQVRISQTDPVAYRDCRKTVSKDTAAASENCQIER